MKLSSAKSVRFDAVAFVGVAVIIWGMVPALNPGRVSDKAIAFNNFIGYALFGSALWGYASIRALLSTEIKSRPIWMKMHFILGLIISTLLIGFIFLGRGSVG